MLFRKTPEMKSFVDFDSLDIEFILLTQCHTVQNHDSVI